MDVIYKYPLMPVTPALVGMPKGARIIHVGSQGDAPVLWALVDPEQPKEMREFWIYGTGHRIDHTEHKYLGTCQTKGGFVWHVFERELT